MFIDRTTLTLKAGRGGNGVVAWMRAKYIPKGGPCGGDGGKGGDILIVASKDIFSLDHFRNITQIKADNGTDGGANRWHGKSGATKILRVPCGTFVKCVETGEILRDLTEDKEEFLICKGGNGGFGNNRFKSPTNRAPIKCTPGRDGLAMEVELELKLIADVGFVGLPNAGKSTLLSAITPNQVKIGDYPFTTLKPNLSYVQFPDYSRVYLADIPGIIKDAHLGRGLGIEFLKHIERSAALVFVIDIAAEDGHDPLQDFHLLQNEIASYDTDLLEKPFIIALNKADLPGAEAQIAAFKKSHKNVKDKIFPISAKHKEGLADLIEAMRALAQEKGKKY